MSAPAARRPRATTKQVTGLQQIYKGKRGVHACFLVFTFFLRHLTAMSTTRRPADGRRRARFVGRSVARFVVLVCKIIHSPHSRRCFCKIFTIRTAFVDVQT